MAGMISPKPFPVYPDGFPKDEMCIRDRYTIADDVLYKMDMNKGTKKELATGLNEDQYVASEDGHLVAYEKEDPSKSKSVTVMNLSLIHI